MSCTGPGGSVFEGSGGGAEGGFHRALRIAAGGDVDGEADVVAEKVQLHGGLVGAGTPQFLGPVGGEDHQRHGSVVGLHDGRQEVPDGGAGGGQHGGRGAGGQGQAKGGEAGGALVDPDQQLHPAGGVGLGQRVGHGRRSGSPGPPRRERTPASEQRRDGDARGLHRAQSAVRAGSRFRRTHMFSGVSMPSSSRPPESRRSTSAHRASREFRTGSSALSTGHWS